VTKYYYHAGIMPEQISPCHERNVFDRTRSTFDLPDIEPITPIGKLIEPKTIEQICHDRVQYILDQAGNKKVVIAWSGGIDSTLVLSEFLKLAPVSQLTVMLNDMSIVEYPLFYKTYIENKIETVAMDYYTDNLISDLVNRQNSVIVTGQSLDQTFGDEDCRYYPEDILSQSVEKFMEKLNSYTFECYTRSLQTCPRKIESVKELFWWLCYTNCYQNGELNWLFDVEELILEKNIFHFASNQDWNDYSVSTPMEIKYPGYDYRNFKIELKKQLYKFTQDRDYTDNKIKVASWRRYRNNEQRKKKPLYITTDWKRGYVNHSN